MFGRIMAVVVAVIVLMTSVLSGLGLYTLTSRQTAIRQENLRAEAREIAYLASLYSGGSSTYTLGTSLFSGSAQNTVALKTSAGRRRRCTTSTARISRLSTALAR